jgi:hypothetical protein
VAYSDLTDRFLHVSLEAEPASTRVTLLLIVVYARHHFEKVTTLRKKILLCKLGCSLTIPTVIFFVSQLALHASACLNISHLLSDGCVHYLDPRDGPDVQ